MKECAFIDKLMKTRPPVSKDIVCGMGDDCAVLRYSKTHYQLHAIDSIVEGVHFRAQDHPWWIGHKALACNMSDIAAMGGIAKTACVTLGFPKNYSESKALALYQGICKLARKHSLSIIGGDTVRAPKLFLTIAITGIVEKTRVVYRSGAKPGDAIFCTGRLGGSLAGKHLTFRPRQKEARWLVENFKIHAMIDISDGLVRDLGHICTRSHCGAALYEKRIPLSKALDSAMPVAERLRHALYDGEDYELLFTITHNQKEALIHKAKKAKIPLFLIGEILVGATRLYLRNGFFEDTPLRISGYEHT